MSGEGYIKFRLVWHPGPPPTEEEVAELQLWRRRLYALKLVGACPDGVGYGDLSRRCGAEIIITGTQTGMLAELTADHFTRVAGFDLETNSLTAVGPVKPSSEAISHAACYTADKAVGAVIHVHHAGLWRKLLDEGHRTSPEAAYGSPELARELGAVMAAAGSHPVVIGVSGHPEGVFAAGAGLETAGAALLAWRARADL